MNTETQSKVLMIPTRGLSPNGLRCLRSPKSTPLLGLGGEAYRALVESLRTKFPDQTLNPKTLKPTLTQVEGFYCLPSAVG